MRLKLLTLVAAGLLIGCAQDDKVVIPANPAPLPTQDPQPFGAKPAATPSQVTPAAK